MFMRRVYSFKENAITTLPFFSTFLSSVHRFSPEGRSTFGYNLSFRKFKVHDSEPPSKLRVFLGGHIVAMVTYCATKLTATRSPVIGQFVDTMILASTDKEWL